VWPNLIGKRSNAGKLLPIQISSQASTSNHSLEETNPDIAERLIYAQSGIQGSAATGSALSLPPDESDKTRRARYAANQRHKKALQARRDSDQNEDRDTVYADGRKKRHREKNKVAAAKCRSRQRKQVQTIQEKGSRLGEENAKLKTIIQELRNELNALRFLALEHQACTCRVAQYNFNQAEKIVAEYNHSRMQPDLGGYSFPSETASLPSATTTDWRGNSFDRVYERGKPCAIMRNENYNVLPAQSDTPDSS